MGYSYADIKRYRKNELIIREGEVADVIFLILEGKVRLIKRDEQDREVEIGYLSEGQVFGEMGFILEEARTYTAKAFTNVKLKLINPRVFSELYDTEHADLIKPIIQSMAERIRHYNMLLLENADKASIINKTSDDNSPELTIIPKTDYALEALNGKSKIEIGEYPLYCGRFSRRRSDDMFHSNNLMLYDNPPFTVSRSHFSVLLFKDELVFYDRGSTLGTFVNNIQIGGSRRAERKTVLHKGSNEVQIGSVNSLLVFDFIVS